MAPELDRAQLAAFCRRHGIRRLALFGSVLREDFRPESDVDVLAEFEPEARVGFFELFDLEEALGRFFPGHRVEINTPASLSPYFRDEVLEEAEVLYVAA